MNVPSIVLRFRYIWSELGEREEFNYSVKYGLPVYNSSGLLKNLYTYQKQLKMKEDRFVTHEELGVERRLSSLEGSFLQHQRYFTALSVMMLAVLIGIFSMFFALMSEMAEVKSEVSALKVTMGEVKDDIANLDRRVINIETYLRLNGMASPNLSNNGMVSPNLSNNSSLSSEES